MKLNRLTIILCGATLLSLNTKAQKIELLEGDLSFLRHEKHIVTQFTYDSMRVGKFDREEDYINYRRDTLNKLHPGKGDKWAQEWVSDRKKRFEPDFNEMFDDNSKMTTASQATYTLIFKTRFTEPGFETGTFVQHMAEIRGEAWIVETANPAHVLAKMSIAHSSQFGMMGSFDTGKRLAQAYGEVGEAVALFIRKKD